MRTTIDVPDHLLRQAKATAALRGIKLKDLFAMFLERGLKEDSGIGEAKPITRTLPPSIRQTRKGPTPSFTSSELQEGFDQEDFSGHV